MKTRLLQVSEGDRSAVVYADSLVLTIHHSASEGYEILVEVGGDEYAAQVPVTISNAIGESVEWEL